MEKTLVIKLLNSVIDECEKEISYLEDKDSVDIKDLEDRISNLLYYLILICSFCDINFNKLSIKKYNFNPRFLDVD